MMKNYLFLALALWCWPAIAQIQFDSLQDLLEYADKHAIAIQTASISEQIALSEQKEAKSYLLPNVSASLGYNDNITLQPTLVPAQLFNPEAPEGSFEELNFGTKFQYSQTFQAQWDVLNFQKIFAVKTAELRVGESRVNTELNRYNTYNQLASTYYSILLTEEAIRIYEENLEVAESILTHATDKHEEGVISAADRNLAEIKKLQSQKSLSLAENNLSQLYIQLQSQLNTKEVITITDKPQDFVLDDNEIRTKHPQVVLEEIKLTTYQSVLKQQKAQRLPSLSLVYQNNRNWATNNFMGFSDANYLPQQLFGVQISMAGLFSSTTRQKINQSKLQLELQQRQLDNTILVKQQEDDLLQLELKQNSKLVTENSRILSLQEQNDVHAEHKYQAGIMSLDSRLDKYDDLLLAQNDYLQSLADYTLAQYKIYIRQIDFQP